MASTKGKNRSPQQSLSLKELEPVEAPPERKTGPRNSHLAKVAETLKASPNQWFRIGYGKRASAYQKRMRLKALGKVEGLKYEIEVRSDDENVGMSNIYARFVPVTDPATGE